MYSISNDEELKTGSFNLFTSMNASMSIPDDVPTGEDVEWGETKPQHDHTHFPGLNLRERKVAVYNTIKIIHL